MQAVTTSGSSRTWTPSRPPTADTSKRMKVSIDKIGSANATASVTLDSSGERRVLDDPVGQPTFWSSGTSYISQSWWTEKEVVDLWLDWHFHVVQPFRGYESMIDISAASHGG